MKKKCNLSRCYFHNYKDKLLLFAVARTGIRVLEGVTFTPSTSSLFSHGHCRQSCGWLSIDYFLCPQYHSHAKSCEIFFSFISTLRCCILYHHSPLLVPANTAHLSKLQSFCVACKLVTVIMLPSLLMGLCAYQSTVFLCLLVYCNGVSMCGMCVHT